MLEACNPVAAGKQAFKALMHRDWLLMKRNMFVYAFKAVQASLSSSGSSASYRLALLY